MSFNKINFYDALQLHFKLGSDPSLIFHCSHVMNIALQILEQLPDEVKCDRDLVLIGAFLHDIGRTSTQGIKHGIAGSKIIKNEFIENDFTLNLANIASRHIGGGIPKDETKELGLPFEDFLPISLEEKIVCYADKLADYDFEKIRGNYSITNWYTYDSIENEVSKLSEKLGNHPAIKRLYDIEKYLIKLNNNKRFVFQEITE